MSNATTFFARVSICCAVALVSACGGSSEPVDTSPDFPDPTDGAMSRAQMRSAVTGLFDDFADPISYTALASIPMSGSASYNGYFYGDLANAADDVTDSLIGSVNIQVAFNASSATVSGSVSNLVDEDSEVIAGSLTLTDGRLARDGNPEVDATLTILANGQLTEIDGDILDFESQFEGDFLGSSSQAIGGNVFGSVTVSGESQDFDGGLIASRE